MAQREHRYLRLKHVPSSRQYAHKRRRERHGMAKPWSATTTTTRTSCGDLGSRWPRPGSGVL